ncbi:MAG TPA: UDP-phosphate galactose phosphotransferase [Cyanobacteria bacterium UBA12227]|nr:UDP-phosphate galactose phosphotransferase [Cyanobacteria bacterium UBA12227]HAX87660.1 UDP-phosphate galactose phosphotransferase [Cyanobacteria bacterium UBA11370]HBY80759.1 UDP-phosphate galactose phosphotransferase [Cyanobacteria bacterium UBA11148]
MTPSTHDPNSANEQPPRDHNLCPCTLKWRQGKLLVRRWASPQLSYVPVIESEQWLSDRLKCSSVKAISLDPALSETELQLWANACEQAGKSVFLRIASKPKLPRKHSRFSWYLKYLIDWSAAALLIVVLSPVLLALAALISISSSEPVFLCQWRVGKRGKLFRMLKFRTMVVDAEKLHHQIVSDQSDSHQCEENPPVTVLGHWMRKWSLDKLPQLINVLRGEMSLVGPCPWTLYDVGQLNSKGLRRLNVRPGMTGVWRVKAQSNLLDIEALNRCDLDYLISWSLWQDFKILLMIFPNVLSFFYAC